VQEINPQDKVLAVLLLAGRKKVSNQLESSQKEGRNYFGRFL
jgi:hypothetical protein